jgi:hypothetical protein
VAGHVEPVGPSCPVAVVADQGFADVECYSTDHTGHATGLSHRAPTLVRMSPASACSCAVPRPSAVVNEEIRRFTQGRLVWSAEALRELARLRAEWQAAVAREAELAA